VVMDKGLRPPRRRPGAHFAPKANWMNDPNGLIFWNGQYHLFYQHNPRSTTPFAKICWGHAKSPDLVHWEDLPLALTPTPGSVDEDGCWSGRAVVNNGQVFLLYTGFGQRRQRPCAARALDDQLVSFEKLKENPVIPDEPLPGLIGFRDSAVRRVNGELRQLIGSGSASTGGCLLEYSTKDLTSWDYCGIFLSASAAGLPGQMWECPDFFEVDGRSFLVISLLEGKDPLGVLSVGGAIKGDQFFPEVERRLDIGSRWYAPQSFDAPDGRRIVFGWLREHEDELPESDRGRVGVMSLPRQLFAAPDGTLGMAPIAELKRLQSEVFALVGEGRGDGTILSTTRDVEAVEVEVAVTGPGTLRVDLLDKDGGIVVAAAVSAEGIELGTSNTAASPAGAFPAGPVRFFYDGGICEVFTANGVARSEIFYDRPLVRSVAVRGQPMGQQTRDHDRKTVQAWHLANIW
jgi:beta-fructofuranosidase